MRSLRRSGTNRLPVISPDALVPPDERGGYGWYEACERAAGFIDGLVPAPYRSRTFSGIIGDIKVLPPRKALSLISRKKGLGLRYAQLYLATGIDHGYGYQACASEAVKAVLGGSLPEVVRGRVMDTGCAVGVSAGVLGLDGVIGFDLFPDLLRLARLVDALTGAGHQYVAADMTVPWPFADASFDTVICGLACHHLKEQGEVQTFFSEANRVLRPDGALLVTLPAGSVAKAGQFNSLIEALGSYGFPADLRHTGLVISTDSPHSLFWMFLITAVKDRARRDGAFVHPAFGFPEFRTPVTREQKGDRARATVSASRRIRHRSFRLFEAGGLEELFKGEDMVFGAIAERCGITRDSEHHGG